MKQYEAYRIEKRKYSSNIIEGMYVVKGEAKWEKILAPLLPKNEGDELCNKVFKILSGES